MKPSILLLALVLVLGSSVATAQSSRTDAKEKQCKFKTTGDSVQMVDKSKRCVSVLKELEAVFAERVKAVRNIDADAQVAMVSPDYSATEPNGQTFTYDQIIAYIRGGPQQIISVQDFNAIIESLTIRGDEAIVDARQKNFSRTQRLRDGNVHNVLTGV